MFHVAPPETSRRGEVMGIYGPTEGPVWGSARSKNGITEEQEQCVRLSDTAAEQVYGLRIIFNYQKKKREFRVSTVHKMSSNL